MVSARALTVHSALSVVAVLAMAAPPAGADPSSTPSAPAAAVPADGSGRTLAPTGDPVFDALWADAVAEADALDPDVPDDQVDADTDGTPFEVDEDEQDAGDDVAGLTRGVGSKDRSARATVRLTGEGGRRRAVVSCRRSSVRRPCAGSVTVRSKGGRALRTWKVRVAVGAQKRLAVPAGARSVAYATPAG